MSQAASKNWTARAALIVGLCFAINMVDGMDVTIMSYIRGALSKAWAIPDALMGYVLSAGLVGMALGALFIAPMADTYGRKPVIMAALVLMSAGMLASGSVPDVWWLMAARIVVGMGIGTVLATMAALSAEAAPEGRANMAVGFVQAGYPLAAVFTGFAVSLTIHAQGWQVILLMAGVVTLIMLPIAWFILPKHMQTKERAQHSALNTVIELFSPALRMRTLLLWTAIFSGLMVLYFIVSWITKLSVAAGLSETNSIYAGAIYNFGAFVGTLLMGLFSLRLPMSRIVAVLLCCAGVAMMIFGTISMSIGMTLGMAFLIGLTLQGGYNGIWPIAAGAYGAERRATGIGWAMGIGRGGAIIGPIMGGYLISAKLALPLIFAVYCVPLLICAFCAWRVGSPLRPNEGIT